MKRTFTILLTLLLITTILFSCKNRSASKTITGGNSGRDTFQMMGSFVNFPKQEIAKSVMFVVTNDTTVFKIIDGDSSTAKKTRIRDTTFFRPFSYYDSTRKKDSLVYVPTAFQSVSVHPIVDSQTAILMRWIKNNQQLWPDSGKLK